MMGIGNLIAAFLFDRIIQRALPHFRAQRAGICLLPLLENNVCNIRLNDGIGNLQFIAADAFNSAQIQILESQVHRHGMQFKMLRIEPLQSMKGIKQRQGILSSRNPHRNPVALLYHMIIVRSPANVTQYLLKSHKKQKSFPGQKTNFSILSINTLSIIQFFSGKCIPERKKYRFHFQAAILLFTGKNACDKINKAA